MRKCLVALAVMALPVMAPAPAHALPTCGGGVDVMTYNAQGGCEFGGLILSDFNVVDAGAETVLVNAVSASVVDGTVFFNFNPNLATEGSTEDIWFFFKVTGSLIGVDLFNGGTGNTSITELVCSDVFDTNTGACTGSLLATMFAGSQGSDEAFFNPVSTAYIFKDIFKGLETSQLDEGHLTRFSQSFHIPEPGTVALLGLGLLGFGRAVRRRRIAA